MTRKKRDFTREITPDPKYQDVLVSKVVNVLMRDGKRGIAEKALYTALDHVRAEKNQEPIELFHNAMENIRPLVEVRSRRVGGATYQVPTEVAARRSESLAIRWLITSANERSERTVGERLANELLEALENRGGAVKKREDTHRMAEANKAFAHFRW